MKINKFKESLKLGLKGEELLHDKLENYLRYKALSTISFKENPNLQKRGIDKLLLDKEIGIDIKTRTAKYYRYKGTIDFLFETVSIMENDTPGWFYTSESELIFYVWFNQDQTNFLDGYILLLKEIRNWFKDKKTNYPQKVATSRDKNSIWHTENRVVPIKDLPTYSTVQFNPKITENKETELSELTKQFNLF